MRLISQKLIHIVLVDKFIMRWEFSLSRQSILGCNRESTTSRLREWHHPSAGGATHEMLHPVLSFWEQEMDITSKGPQRCLRDQSMFYMRWGWENWAGRSENSEGNLPMCRNTLMEGCKANKASSAYWQDKRQRTQTKAHEILLNIKKKISRQSGQILEHVAQEDCTECCPPGLWIFPKMETTVCSS